MPYPRVLINTAELRYNLDLLADLCHSLGISLTAVGKCIGSHPAYVQAVNDSRADMIADARLSNLARMETDKPRMLLRVPMPSEVNALPLGCEYSLQSEAHTIRLLAQSARSAQRRHRVVLMVDLGDLREGIMYDDRRSLREAAEAVLASDWLELYGLGVNYSCFSGVAPDARNVGWLLELAQMLRDEYRIPLPMVSGGATSTLEPLLRGRLPAGITNLRLGGATLVPWSVSSRLNLKDLPGLENLRDDAFIMEAELIEKKLKPSKPIGSVCRNAFGEEAFFADKGAMLRGICACGRMDVDHASMVPLDENLEILGGSSDHTIIDMTGAPDYELGDIIRFRLYYGSLMRAFLSPHVEKLTV